MVSQKTQSHESGQNKSIRATSPDRHWEQVRDECQCDAIHASTPGDSVCVRGRPGSCVHCGVLSGKYVTVCECYRRKLKSDSRSQRKKNAHACPWRAASPLFSCAVSALGQREPPTTREATSGYAIGMSRLRTVRFNHRGRERQRQTGSAPLAARYDRHPSAPSCGEARRSAEALTRYRLVDRHRLPHLR